jgi:Pheromone A receptor
VPSIPNGAHNTKTDSPHAILDPPPPLVVHEMAPATGVSHLYPVLPVMNFLAMVLMLLLIPGFWKTRIVALVALVGWIFVTNMLYFIGMIHWRGHTNDAPVLASICELFISSSSETYL